MDTNDSDTGTETGEGEGSEGTQTPNSSNGTDELTLARRRQAGAEAARHAAETKAAESQRQLDEFLGKQRSDEEAKIADVAGWKAKFEAEKTRADTAEAKATGRILDAKFPNARKELPEMTDEVRLAKFEALLADGGPSSDEDETPPTPLKHNEKSTGAATGEKKEATAAETKAALLAMPSPW